MRKVLVLTVFTSLAVFVQAADVESGNVMASTVWAACHGANGVSVSSRVPHLAGQRAAYVAGQLEANRLLCTLQTMPPCKQSLRVRRCQMGPKSWPKSTLAKLDAAGTPLVGADRHFVPGQLQSLTGMAREAGWGKDIPAMLSNDNWNYAVFNADRTRRTDLNLAECLVCHSTQKDSSFLFLYSEMAAASHSIEK